MKQTYCKSAEALYHSCAGQVVTSREVWSWDVLYELGNGDVWIMYQGLQPRHHLAQVVGRYLGGNTHSDPSCAIDEQMRHSCRQNCWLVLEHSQRLSATDSLKDTLHYCPHQAKCMPGSAAFHSTVENQLKCQRSALKAAAALQMPVCQADLKCSVYSRKRCSLLS